jgi:hypothetical protein
MLRPLSLRAAALVALVALVALSALPLSAQTIVQTGDDLAALVAAAPNGAEFEIRSDSTFVGSLDRFVLDGKSVTIRAASGFSPTIKGDVGHMAVDLIATTTTSGAIIEGVRIVRGDTGPSPIHGEVNTPAAISGGGTSGINGATYCALTLIDCSVSGSMWFGGTGLYRGTYEFRSTDFENDARFSGTGEVIHSLTFVDCTVGELLYCGQTGLAVADLTLSRCSFADRLLLSAISSSALTLTAESCLVAGDGTVAIGVETEGNTIATFTNLTVTGFGTGISGHPGATWHNMLLYGNGADLANVAAGEIHDSLISDGTHDGVDGNFAATPDLAPGHVLRPCSPGRDAGDSTAPGLGALDLAGQPRIQDSDGDGTPRVNVGAFEVTLAQAGDAVLANGSGINPVEYLPLNKPSIGAPYQARIPIYPGTDFTIIAYDVPAAPFQVVEVVGEILLAFSPAVFYDVKFGAHSLPIPANCAFVGIQLASQGFRVESSQGYGLTHALNRVDLTIGG